MLILDQLNLKEKIYLAELVRAAKLMTTEIGPETLSCLKQNVLEVALKTVNIDPRKRKVLEKIISKVKYPYQIIEGEIVIPEERRIE